jgi:hypothetical protein
MLLEKSNDNDDEEELDVDAGIIEGNEIGDDNIGQPFEMA